MLQERPPFDLQMTGDDEEAQSIDLDAIDVLQALEEHAEARRQHEYRMRRARMTFWEKLKELCSCRDGRPR